MNKKNEQPQGNSYRPSVTWENWLEQLAFISRLHDHELRLHVGFGYYLGAPIENDIWRANRFKSGEVDAATQPRKDYVRLVSSLPEHMKFTEPDPCREIISVTESEMSTRYINADILRMQADASNMWRLGLLSSAKRIVEIGAGYGMMAANLIRAGITRQYLIIDLPEILEISARWLGYLWKVGELPVPVYTQFHSDDMIGGKDGVFLLPSDNFSQSFERLECDILINLNSFCEMPSDVVQNYIKGAIKFSKLYSANSEKQFMNDEIGRLSDIFSQNIKCLWPKPEDYRMIDESIKKYVYVGSNEMWSPPKDMLISNLHGVVGPKRPSINC